MTFNKDGKKIAPEEKIAPNNILNRINELLLNQDREQFLPETISRLSIFKARIIGDQLNTPWTCEEHSEIVQEAHKKAIEMLINLINLFGECELFDLKTKDQKRFINCFGMNDKEIKEFYPTLTNAEKDKLKHEINNKRFNHVRAVYRETRKVLNKAEHIYGCIHNGDYKLLKKFPEQEIELLKNLTQDENIDFNIILRMCDATAVAIAKRKLNSIILCEKFFERNEKLRACTIVHEATHLLDEQLRTSHPAGNQDPHKNADNYGDFLHRKCKK